MRLLVIDGNAPWVRSFFAAMPVGVTIDYLRVYSVVNYVRSRIGPANDVFRWRQTSCRTREMTVLVPGWTRLYAASSAIVQSAVRMARREGAPIDALTFTSPYYAGVSRAFSAIPRFYLAHDVFRFYDWDQQQIAKLEKQMLDSCDASLVVARALVEDFQRITNRPVEYSPMAATTEFVNRLSEPRGEMPEDLISLPRPIVGCIGQMNRSYDWNLIATLADAMPDVTFAFVGPVFPEPTDVLERIQAVFAKPNVKNLGVKPHPALPNYLMHFDVCFNPLAVNEHSDRRSPLRLFDYLATDRPILSTAIREAHEHLPLIEIGRTVAECTSLLRTMLASNYRIDHAARKEYIRVNTWEARAGQLLRLVAKHAEHG